MPNISKDCHSSSSHHHPNLRGKKLFFTIFLNAFIAFAQGAAGLFSQSLSLVSDALHNLSDVFSLIISYVAEKLIEKSHTPSQTFGYKRAEILAALLNSLLLMVVAVYLCGEAWERFYHPVVIKASWVITFAILGMLVNGLSILILKTETSNNLNMKAASLHLFSDFMNSVVVLFGGVCIYIWEIFWIDSVLTILLALYLFVSSWKLLAETVRMLMMFSPSHLDVFKLEKTILTISEVSNIHHLHVWQLNGEDIHLEAHIDFKDDLPLSKISQLLGEIRGLLWNDFQIKHVVLQPEIGVKDAKDLVLGGCHH